MVKKANGKHVFISRIPKKGLHFGMELYSLRREI